MTARPITSKATAQGLRQEQQDRCLCCRIEIQGIPHGRGQLMAVADGHGGHETADIIVAELAALFARRLKQAQGRVEDALRQTIAELVQRTRNGLSGSTLSIVFKPDDQQRGYVAVLGDSPVIMTDQDGKRHVGPLHNVRSNLAERSQALARGARYAAGYIEIEEYPEEGLQLSRALGDRHFDRVLDRTPEIFSVALGSQSFILVGTDGLLHALNPSIDDQLQGLADLVQKGADAQAIVDNALRRRTGDNVTAIVWRATAE